MEVEIIILLCKQVFTVRNTHTHIYIYGHVPQPSSYLRFASVFQPSIVNYGDQTSGGADDQIEEALQMLAAWV